MRALAVGVSLAAVTLPKPLYAAIVALTTTLCQAAAASLEDRAAGLYRPFQAEMVALSPDGKYVAYSRHARGELAVIVMAVDNPASRMTINVADDRRVSFSKEKQAVRLRFLRWITPTRLVFAPTEETISMPGGQRVKVISHIFAADADGRNAKKLVDGSEFTVTTQVPTPAGSEDPPTFVDTPRHINVIGFPAGDAQHVLVEALTARPEAPAATGEVEPAPADPLARAPRVERMDPTPTSLYKINVFTGKVSLVDEDTYPGRYLYDWQARPRVVYGQPEYSSERKFLQKPPGSRSRWQALDPKSAGPAATGFTISPANYFGERAVPLAFDFDGKTLLFGSNAGRDTFGIYGLDLETKQRTALAIEHPHFDLTPLEPRFPRSALVFDERRQKLVGVRATGVTPLTLWIDPELTAIQQALEAKFPRRTVEILEWDDVRQRFLLRVSGGSDPGRHFVYERAEDFLLEFLRRAPWLRNDLSESTPFEFDTPQGLHLTGYLTLPRAPRLNPPPLLVYFPAGFPARAQPEFDAEAQMLAAMGFVVVRVNYRGAVGFGAKHRNAIQEGVDRVPIDDVLATIAWLGQRHKFDARRWATMGEGFGGYLALRAIQLHPDVFRCAIAIDAPLDLEAWLRPPLREMAAGPQIDFTQEVHRAFFRRGATRLADVSVLRSAATLTKPVFLIVNGQRHDEISLENSRLRSELKRLGRAPDYLEVQEDYALRLPMARARAFRKIEEFFNLNLYDYKVNVGEVKELK